ncbi:MAG: hypothetical protein AABX01_03015 [Candidatus Micrarchaeota archaeon]
MKSKNKNKGGKIISNAGFGSLKGLVSGEDIIKMREEDRKAEIEHDKMYDEIWKRRKIR